MAVTLIICLSVPLEMLLVYAAAMKLFGIISPEKEPKKVHHHQRRAAKRKHASLDDWTKFQKLL